MSIALSPQNAVIDKRWNRVAPGVPSSGEFAPRGRDEAHITLGATAGEPTEAERQLRRNALLLGGFVPAVAAPPVPGSETSASSWWNAQFVRAEYQGSAGGYAKLPDDFTPKMTGGRAISGHRRTHRIRYESTEVALRMPSATTIKAFSAANNGETFDVPVSASYPGGTVQGWVRITNNGPGEWSVSGLGMDDKANAYISEAVSAVLEARAPSVALANMPDLMARRRMRFAAGGVKINRTEKSGFISGVGYNQAAGTMAVKIGNRHYSYAVSQEVFNRVRAAHAPGQAYNLLVKGHERSEEITSCDRCGRFSTVAGGHRCPSRHKQPTRSVKEFNRTAREQANIVQSGLRLR